MIFGDRETSYAELDAHSNQQAQALLAADLKPQTRIAILANNTDQFFELNYACWKTDVVLVPVNFRLAGPEVEVIVNDAEAELLFVGAEFHDLVASIEDRLSTVCNVITARSGRSQAQLANLSSMVCGTACGGPRPRARSAVYLHSALFLRNNRITQRC
jgi:fatty-acyl-CoA synthase